jgi:hypothetical protein
LLSRGNISCVRPGLHAEFKKICKVVFSIFITYRWGIEAMLWGQIVTSFLAYYLNSHYTGNLLNYTIFNQIKDFFPYLCAAFAMGLIMSASKAVVGESMLLSLLTGSTLGVVSYYFICKSFQLTAFEEVDSLFKDRIKLSFVKYIS